MLSLGALTVLAFSLDAVSFNDGQRYSQPSASNRSGISLTDMVDTWLKVPLGYHLAVWGSIALLVFLVGLLLSPELRKRLLQFLIRVTLTALGLYYLLKNYGGNLLFLQNFGGGAPAEVEFVDAPPMPVFEPPQVSPTVSYLISFGFALLLVVSLWVIYRAWKKFTALHAITPLEEIAHIARSSLQDLSTGRDSSDVIVRCYLQMSDVVADKHQLERDAAMTPQEFALRLERAGLPGEAVRRLTRLFEMVRYGDRKSSPRDVNEAVSCLKTILHYCGESV